MTNKQPIKYIHANALSFLSAVHDWTAVAHAANMGFAIAGFPCFADTFVQGGSSVLRMKFSAKTPHHRKPLKRV